MITTLIGIQMAYSQKDTISLKPNYKKLRQIMATEAGLYSASIYGLNKVWYTKPFVEFRFVNDGYEWLKMDKVGHTFTAYQIAKYSSLLYKTTGISPKQSTIYGAISGFVFLLPIEILDGFQYPDYGFSASDMAANTIGSTLFLTQMLAWNEERVKFKFSFHQTPLAGFRPELLGKSFSQQWLKDYNGQTYWLSISYAKFLKPESRFPKWLNLSFGYGIQNMVSADPARSQSLGYVPYSQFYLSLDLDLEQIPTKNKFLKTTFKLLNTLKIPTPTLEWSRREGLKGHWLYF